MRNSQRRFGTNVFSNANDAKGALCPTVARAVRVWFLIADTRFHFPATSCEMPESTNWFWRTVFSSFLRFPPLHSTIAPQWSIALTRQNVITPWVFKLMDLSLTDTWLFVMKGNYGKSTRLYGSKLRTLQCETPRILRLSWNYTTQLGLSLYLRVEGPLQRTEMDGLFQEGYCNLYCLFVQSQEVGI